MVHSELPISVLFYDQDGAHLLAMTSGLSGSMQLQSLVAGLSKAEGVARPSFNAS
jgi:hypothetical protein